MSESVICVTFSETFYLLLRFCLLILNLQKNNVEMDLPPAALPTHRFFTEESSELLNKYIRQKADLMIY